ncbi:hypothetical protein [Methylomonas koyamae]|uniref:hypothetical protein n=1 Tax=Methylomonas koyamae TaxID=702114 RepID=UPI0018D364E5|nr:hypothetical protein [Methylomonas koyamae]
MPKIVPSEELDRIEKLIAQYPEGIGAKDIAEQLDFEIKGRTLQRRLATLIAEQRIVSEGDGRALKYKITRASQGRGVLPIDDENWQNLDEVYIPVSPEGEEIKSFIRQPRTQRAPVSYRPDFLGQYYPNNTPLFTSRFTRTIACLGPVAG